MIWQPSMAKPSDPNLEREELRRRLIGLGEDSVHKSYYPQLQRHHAELERFKALLENTFDLIILLSVPSATIIDANATACRALGTSLEMLQQLSFFDLLVGGEEALPGALRRLISSCESEESRGSDVVQLLAADGGRLAVELALSRIAFREQAYVAVVARDVSERLRQEGMLLKVAQGVAAETGDRFFPLLAAALADALEADCAFVGEIVAEPQQSIRTISVWIDGEFEKNFTYDLKGTPGESVVQHGIGAFAEAIQQQFPQDERLKRWRAEAYVGIPLLAADGRSSGIIAVLFRQPLKRLTHTTAMLRIFATRAAAELDRRRQQLLLKRSEERFRTLVANIPAAVYRVRFTPGFEAIFFNDSIASMTGVSAQELMSGICTLGDLVHCDDRDRLFNEISLAVTQRRTFSVEFRLIDQDGVVRWVQNRGQAIFSPEGAVRYLDGTLFDITPHKLAEEALLRFDQQKTHFISTAAHELRTPLASVLGYTEALLDAGEYGGFDRAQQLDFLREIYSRGETLSRLIDDLFDISRIQQGDDLSLEMEEGDLALLAERLVRQFALLGKKHRFVFQNRSEGRFCCFDRTRLTQVLENLLTNAVKYSPQGGEIVVSLSDEAHELRLQVSDHGVGMTREQLARVFDRFYRADMSDTAVGGLGLGMSIVKQIIDAHGGRIEVESTLGEGTHVSIWLPCRSCPPR